MDIIIKLTIPNYIYSFYRDASRNIFGSSPEAVMSDVLSAYAGLISKDIADQRENAKSSGEKSFQSISL